MTTVRKKDSRDSIPESNSEVMAITSPTFDNSPPQICDKSVNTDYSYLSYLSVQNYFFFIFKSFIIKLHFQNYSFRPVICPTATYPRTTLDRRRALFFNDSVNTPLPVTTDQEESSTSVASASHPPTSL